VKRIALSAAAGVVVIIGIACGKLEPRLPAVAPKPSSSLRESPPTIVAEVRSPAKLGRPLELQWSLFNEGDEPVYIYSTLLKSPVSAQIEVDLDRRLIEVRFLRLRTLPFGVNAFPPAEFLKLGPKETRRGNFVSSSRTGKGDLSMISLGTYHLEILIGYGNEISSVQQELARSSAEGIEHPINPIVRWQRVSYSNSVPVTFTR
jgi:hypothetical protein